MCASVLFRRLVLFGVPLTLGILDVFHPTFNVSVIVLTLWSQVNWWLTLHLIQLPLFGLLALAVLMLTTGLPGVAAMISRIAVWFFVVFYLATDTLAGIASGIIIREARNLPSEQLDGIQRIVETFFSDPIVGADNPYSVFLILGSLGWLVSVVAAGIALYRDQRISWMPVALLLSAGLLFGYDHAPPTGPLGMLCFLLVALWIELAPKSRVPG